MVESTKITAQPYIHNHGARLSEGVTYLKASQTLFWVDIFLGEIHFVTNIDDPKASHNVIKINANNYIGAYPHSSELPERVGAVFPVDSPSGVKEAFFAGKYGIGRLSLESCKWNYEVLFSSCHNVSGKDWDRLRSNDGNVAPNGDIYIGVMNDFQIGVDTKKEAEGCLFRVNLKQKHIELVLDNLYIPNSINWNTANDTMYLNDTLKFKTWQMPYEDGVPRVAEKTVFVDFVPVNESFELPQPDGSVVDPRDGFSYCCVFSTHKVQIFNPEAQLHRELVFPETPNMTCCCIGPGGDIFVTTASLDVEHGKSTGPSGALYRVSGDFVTAKGDVPSSKRNPEY
ncbi:LAME_0H13630g1_1 [Lachancea meyersii CBS 8951]|uniref:LAME_0H13630g1_1 n=1 Tax=Lachancea meyersii CBS 8951 TaxID=1266667 RepID=A0A1G4KH28_9SACH|nr:LAME_0H13630g1_1 [Lachancea meyersii CBS 8951]